MKILPHEIKSLNERIYKLEEYTTYLSDLLQKNISYSEYLAKQIHKVKVNFTEVSMDIKIPTFEEFIKTPDKVYKLSLDYNTTNIFKEIYNNTQEHQNTTSKKIRIIYNFNDKICSELIGMSRIDGFPIFKVVENDYQEKINSDKEFVNIFNSELNFNDIKKELISTIEDQIPLFNKK